LLPLSLGMVPNELQEKLIQNIAYNITNNDNGHLRVGHAGITALIESLTANNMGNEMYNIVNTTTYPGWGYMVDQGATTIWECWGRDYAVEGGRRRSDNMTMLAGVNEFFYRYVAGIQGPNFYGEENMKPGYQEFKIKPFPLGDLTSATASVQTIKGKISSSWEKKENIFNLNVEIPVNSTAYVSIPKLGMKNVTISENGIPVWVDYRFNNEPEGIETGMDDKDYITLKVESGKYSFKLKEEQL